MSANTTDLERMARGILNVQPAATIQVSAEAFNAWRRAVALANAATKEAEALKVAAGLPTTENLLFLLDGNLSAVVVDGNGRPIGKVSIAHHPEKTVRAFAAARWS